MKKEFLFKEGKLSLNLFYDDKMLEKKEEKKIKIWSQKLACALNFFCHQKELKIILSSHQVKNIFLNLNLVGDYKIKRLNNEYRGKNKTTDVLSFPMQDNVREGKLDAFHGELELGDIFICKNICIKQAEEFELNFFEEFVHLATHGFLHLIGYDHEISQVEERLMEKLEEKIVKKISSLTSKN